MSRPRSRLLTFAVVLALLGLAVAAERWRWFPRLLASASPERVWIWTAAWPREVTPRAFFLARDFELARVPPGARLSVAADPEYIVRINGVRIGSGIYRPGAPADVYDATAALRPGRNRVLLELRSAVGSGGASLRLTTADGELLAATGEGWGIYEGSWRALMNVRAPLPPAPEAAVLGASPLARWGLPAERVRPVWGEQAIGDQLLSAVAWRADRGAEEWTPFPRRSRHRLGVGALAEVDFGQQVTGYLHLTLELDDPAEGMLFLSDAPLADLSGEPDRVVVAVPHLGFWQDAEPARFRYVTVVGLPTLRGVAVTPLRPEAAAALPAPQPLLGLFGQPTEPARSPLVESLRRQLLKSGAAGG